jgi:hypothetical protein
MGWWGIVTCGRGKRLKISYVKPKEKRTFEDLGIDERKIINWIIPK